MYGGDAYNPWPADPFPTNNMWNGGGYADMDALNQHPCISCEYCGGGHYFSNCPHNPNSLCFVGSNSGYHDNSNTYNSDWMPYNNENGHHNFTGFSQYEEPTEFGAYNSYNSYYGPEQGQHTQAQQQQTSSLEGFFAESMAKMDTHMTRLNAIVETSAHMVQPQQCEQQKSFEEESFRKSMDSTDSIIAMNAAAIQSNAASIRSLMIQLEQMQNAMKTSPSTIEDSYGDEKECWTAATLEPEGRISMQPILIGESSSLTDAAEAECAPAWSAACLPDGQVPADSPESACTSTLNAPADYQASAWSFGHASAWCFAPEEYESDDSQLPFTDLPVCWLDEDDADDYTLIQLAAYVPEEVAADIHATTASSSHAVAGPSESKEFVDNHAAARSFDQAPAWSVAPEINVPEACHPTPVHFHASTPKEEKPTLMVFQRELEPAAHMKPMSGTLPNPDNKRGDVLVNTLAFPVDFMILDLEGSLEAQASSVSRLKLSKHLESCLPIPCKHSIVQLSQEHRSLKELKDRTRFKVSSLKRRLIKKRAYSLLSPIN